MSIVSPPPVPRGLRVGAVLVALVAVGLGVWQIRRDGERNAGLQDAARAADLPVLSLEDPVDESSAWRRVDWGGTWDGAVHLEASRSDGLYNGYGAFQRFRRDDGRTVLVDRGWVPAEGVADRIRALARVADPARLTGQLRPLAGKPEVTPFEGHGTRIWPPRSTLVLRLATGSELPLYVVAGPLDGIRTRAEPPLDGFAVVPERDNTSAHYAVQWFGIAVLAALVAVPRVLLRIRQFVDA